MNMRRRTALTRTYPGAKMIAMSTVTCSLAQPKIGRYQSHVATDYVHKFTCLCVSSYIDKTERRACVQFKEHIPKVQSLSGLKAFSHAIPRHLLDTGHRVDTLKFFKVINKKASFNILKFS